jgi:hypothetical protein
MRYTFFALAGLLYFTACKTPKTTSSTSGIVPATPTVAPVTPSIVPSLDSSLLIGFWAITSIDIIKLNKPIPEDEKKNANEMMMSIKILLTEKGTVLIDTKNGRNTGIWRFDAGNNTINFEMPTDTDVLKIYVLTPDTIKGKLTTSSGDEFEVSLARVK